MKHQLPSTAPDAGSVLKFVVPLIWKSKWLIAAAAILAATVIYALMAPGKIEIWSGRAILTVRRVHRDKRELGILQRLGIRRGEA